MIALLQEEGTGRNLEAVSCRCAAAAAAAALQNSLDTAQTGRTKEEAFVPERNYAAVKAKCVTGNGFDVVCQCLLHFTFPETTTNSWIFFFFFILQAPLILLVVSEALGEFCQVLAERREEGVWSLMEVVVTNGVGHAPCLREVKKKISIYGAVMTQSRPSEYNRKILK